MQNWYWKLLFYIKEVFFLLRLVWFDLCFFVKKFYIKRFLYIKACNLTIKIMSADFVVIHNY